MAHATIEGLAGVLVWTEADRFPAMARFYRDTLGLTPRSDKSDFINFDWNGVRLSVGVHAGVRGASREPLRVMLNLTVADIQAVYDEWSACGAEFLTPPQDRGSEIRCYIRDPDGHLIEVGQTNRAVLEQMGG